MKTLREIKQIEKYLLGELDPAAKLVFEARLLIDPILKLRVQWQQTVYAIIKRSGRRQVKHEVERIHLQLFTDPSKYHFQQDVLQHFSKT